MNRNSRNGNNRIRPYARNDNDNKMRRPFQNSKSPNPNGHAGNSTISHS